MATMRDERERVCPLCAEEMDLTDQQLKPCKCGYEICVWCWNQIMTLAEKDDREGRCPACRTPYNKEKIVATSENCKRFVAEMNMERKLKSQKQKSKTSEGRKQLSNMRVIQRNLVYVMCLPLNLADEDLLQQMEYFGQYGKVVNVSVSRTAAGTIQQFPNNTCSVYITYSKVEEAIRCIQSVHGFVLEGRSLRAFFGTTKYCHAWLRNMPCSNPDCLYLHEFGSEEDRVTKDEIVSTYTRNRVQHITVASNYMQRNSGNVLPPPADEYYNNNCASLRKPISESASNNSLSSVKGSPPNSSSCQSVSLPVSASWGARPSIGQSPSSSLASPRGPLKQSLDSGNGVPVFSTTVASSTQVSVLQADSGATLTHNDLSCTTQQSSKIETLEPKQQHMRIDCQTHISGNPDKLGHSSTSNISNHLFSKDKDGGAIVPPSDVNSVDLSYSFGLGAEKDSNASTDQMMQNLSSNTSSVNIGRHQSLQPCSTEQSRGALTSLAAGVAVTSPENDACVAIKQLDLKSDYSQAQTKQIVNREIEHDLLTFDIQRLKDPKVLAHTGLPNSSHCLGILNNSRVYSGQHSATNFSPDFNGDLQTVDKKISEVACQDEFGLPESFNVLHDTPVSKSVYSDYIDECFNMVPEEARRKQVAGPEHAVVIVDQNAEVDMGENSIISNILSMDFDSWDEPFTSAQNLAKILGETDKQKGSVGISNSRKVQNSNQSRFSFAREVELLNNVTDVKTALRGNGQPLSDPHLSLNLTENKDFYLNKVGNYNGLSYANVEESNNFPYSNSHFSASNLSASRSQIYAPPGYSLVKRTPPPGFSSQEKIEQPYGTHFGNYMSDTSSSLRNHYQASSTTNIGNPKDIEFMDPAILAVGSWRLPGGLDSQGLGIRSNSPMFSAFKDEARLQVLMQRPPSQHQNQRFADMGSVFSHHNGIPTNVVAKTSGNNLPTFTPIPFSQSRNALMSNGLLKGRDDVPIGHNMGFAGQHRTDRMGINKFLNGYEDPAMQMPSSGDLYNRTFGI